MFAVAVAGELVAISARNLDVEVDALLVFGDGEDARMQGITGSFAYPQKQGFMLATLINGHLNPVVNSVHLSKGLSID